MTWFARLRSWLNAVLRRSSLEQDMDDELRFHIDSVAADLERAGMSPADARRRARAEFGAIEASKDDCREARGLRLIDEARADMRYAVRQLRRSPIFAAVAIASLGLGIGANATIFGLMESAVWKAMPVPAPAQLRLFTWVSGPHNVMDSSWDDWDGGQWNRSGLHSTALSYVLYQTLQQRASSFESIFAFKPIGRVTAIVGEQAELINASLVSGNYFDGLRVVPILGRAIVPGDDVVGNGEIVGVISEGYWARRFGRDPAVIGRQVTVNQFPVTIVGVTPPGFIGVESDRALDVFLPLATQPRLAPRGRRGGTSLLEQPDYWWLTAMGRLKPDVSDAQAESESEVILQQVVQTTLPADRATRDQPHLRLYNGSRGLDNLRGQFGRPLFLLFGFVALVLLIACANVANLLLARAAARRRELTVRLALGAGRARIARQLLTEGLVLGLGGGLVGLVIAYAARNVIPSLLVDPWITHRLNAAFDVQVLLLTTSVTIVTSVLFSLAPMWESTRVDLNGALKDAGGRGLVGAVATMRAKALIVAQVAISVLLLIAAGLFMRTLSNLQAVPLGFTPERLVLFGISPPSARYNGAERTALFERIREQLAMIPGVEEATLSDTPLTNNHRALSSVALDTDPHPRVAGWVNAIGYRFIEAMRIPMIAGRSFDQHDRLDTPLVAVVTQEFARTFYPGVANVVGRTFRNQERVYRIVGVCGDTHFDNTRSPLRPTFYLLVAQQTDNGSMTFELRTSSPTGTLMGSVRRALDVVDKDLPIADVRTQTQQIDATMASERLFATLTAAFGVLALLLACIGIYGVISHSVSRRTGEIGIRIALGAQRVQVLLMILGDASALALLGVMIGAAGAAWLSRYVEAMLFGVQAIDPLTIASAVAIMLGVALFAGWLPARRAARVDPMVALRNE